MAIVVPDIACLREPRLLQPTRRPVGPVKVDQSVLSQPVGWAIFPDQPVSIEGSMWPQKRTTIDNKTTTYPDVTNGNPGEEFTASVDEVDFQGYTFIPINGDFTVLVHITPKNLLASYEYVLGIVVNFSLFVNHTSAAGQWGFYSPVTGSGKRLTAGQEYVLILRRKDNLINFFTDGVKESGSLSHTAYIGYTTPTTVRFNAYSGSGLGTQCHIPFAAFIVGALSDSECSDLGRDPYQFLIPG